MKHEVGELEDTENVVRNCHSVLADKHIDQRGCNPEGSVQSDLCCIDWDIPKSARILNKLVYSDFGDVSSEIESIDEDRGFKLQVNNAQIEGKICLSIYCMDPELEVDVA